MACPRFDSDGLQDISRKIHARYVSGRDDLFTFLIGSCRLENCGYFDDLGGLR